MKTIPIRQLNNKEVFPNNDDLRNWIFKNRKKLEEVLQIKLSRTTYNPDAPYLVRPDICTGDFDTCDRIAVMINIENTSEKEFFRYLTIAALNDVKKIVWIVTDLDDISYSILEWLNDRTEGNVEFIVVKLVTYEMPDSQIITKLERFERLPVPIDYEDML